MIPNLFGGIMFVDTFNTLIVISVGLAIIVIIVNIALSSSRAELGDTLLGLCLRLRCRDRILADEYLTRRSSIRWLKFIDQKLETQYRQISVMTNRAGYQDDEIVDLAERIKDDLNLYKKKIANTENHQRAIWQALLFGLIKNPENNTMELQTTIDYRITIIEKYNRRLRELKNKLDQ